MSGFNATPTDVNGTPMPTVVVPGDKTPKVTKGGPATTDSQGNPLSGVSLYVYDGDNETLGRKSDADAIDSTSAWSVIALLKGILARLLGTLNVNVTNTTPLGPATMAASSPVVIASNQTVPINVADGASVTLGAKADTAATDATSPWSIKSLLAGILKPFLHANGSGILYVDVGQSTGSLGVYVNGGSLTVRNLGNNTQGVTAGTTANTLISQYAGYLCGVIIASTGGAAPIQLYDSHDLSGTLIAYIPSGATPGWYPFPVPVSSGICLRGASGNPAVTVVWFQ